MSRRARNRPDKRAVIAPNPVVHDCGEEDDFDPYEEDAHFSNLHKPTWSKDNASGCGIKYVRADLLAAAPQAEPQPDKIAISPLEEQQMFDDWCPYKGNPDPRVVWAAAIDAANGMLAGIGTKGGE